MIVGIVGTSHLTPKEETKAREEIRYIIQSHMFNGDTHFVTGDANGIDKLVRELTCKYKTASTFFEAEKKQWTEFKKRNIEIAKFIDGIYCITTKTKDEMCYHCNQDHQRTGGCWTLKYAKSLGKRGEVIVI